MARLVIFGAGDIARLAHFYFRTDSSYEVAAFVVDPEFRTGDTFDGLPLVDTTLSRAGSRRTRMRCSWP